MSSYLAHLAEADPSLSAILTYSVVFACTVLIGIWASVETPRLVAAARNGQPL